MKIFVTWGTGEGNTSLSAFDRALFDAGIANLNLLPLSSVIPPKTEIIVGKLDVQQWKKHFGQRVYVVLSEQRTSKKGATVFAGVGWVIDQKEKKGLFVEHHGKSAKEVEDLIRKSLLDMTKYREEEYGEINFQITGIKCKKKPVAALVCAVYQVEEWHK